MKFKNYIVAGALALGGCGGDRVTIQEECPHLRISPQEVFFDHLGTPLKFEAFGGDRNYEFSVTPRGRGNLDRPTFDMVVYTPLIHARDSPYATIEVKACEGRASAYAQVYSLLR